MRIFSRLIQLLYEYYFNKRPIELDCEYHYIIWQSVTRPISYGIIIWGSVCCVIMPTCLNSCLRNYRKHYWTSDLLSVNVCMHTCKHTHTHTHTHTRWYMLIIIVMSNRGRDIQIAICRIILSLNLIIIYIAYLTLILSRASSKCLCIIDPPAIYHSYAAV